MPGASRPPIWTGHYALVEQLAFADVVDELRTAVPEFAPTIDDHEQFYEQTLPHVLFGDLMRFILAAREDGDDDVVQRSRAFLERALREGDDATRTLVQGLLCRERRTLGPHD